MTKEITNKYISNVDNGVDYRGNKMLFEYSLLLEFSFSEEFSFGFFQ